MDTKQIVKDIIAGLREDPFQDLSDVGNIIGMALGNNGVQENGNDLQGFFFGVRHGMDLMAKEKPDDDDDEPLDLH